MRCMTAPMSVVLALAAAASVAFAGCAAPEKPSRTTSGGAAPPSPTAGPPPTTRPAQSGPALAAPCESNLLGAYTIVDAEPHTLYCARGPAGQGVWESPPFLQRPFTKWLTVNDVVMMGPASGMEVDIAGSDEWIGLPQDDGACTIEQATDLGDRTADTAPTGQPLSFEVLPNLRMVTLKGHCLWMRVAD